MLADLLWRDLPKGFIDVTVNKYDVFVLGQRKKFIPSEEFVNSSKSPFHSNLVLLYF